MLRSISISKSSAVPSGRGRWAGPSERTEHRAEGAGAVGGAAAEPLPLDQKGILPGDSVCYPGDLIRLLVPKPQELRPAKQFSLMGRNRSLRPFIKHLFVEHMELESGSAKWLVLRQFEPTVPIPLLSSRHPQHREYGRLLPFNEKRGAVSDTLRLSLTFDPSLGI